MSSLGLLLVGLAAVFLGVASGAVAEPSAEPGTLEITTVEVLDLTPDSAVITWTIDRPATGQIDYGMTPAYGSQSELEPSFDYSTHVQDLTNLRPRTVYHYRVRSMDEAGNEVVSADQQFTTLSTNSNSSFEQPGAHRFGAAIAADNLNNAVVGGPIDQVVSFRFRATESSALESIVVYIVDETHEGYGAGDGGQLRITVRRDDGTEKHRPQDEVIAEVIAPDPGGGPGVEYRFPTPPQLVKGRLYHVVFENVDPDPEHNYVSVNGLYVYDEQPVWQPAFPNTDWAHLVRIGSKPWTSDRGPGRGTITPIMALNYANGKQGGVGYMEVWYREPQVISGDRRVREVFTVGGKDRAVSSVSVRLKRVQGNDPLVIRLRDSHGRLIASGKVPADSIAISPPEDLGGASWARAEFPEQLTLRAGEEYRLLLSTREDTEYSIFAIREGATYGFGPTTYFADGTAQFSDDGSWEPFVGFGNPNVEGDLQFFFETAPSSAQDS